jgi:predicted RNA-binding protein associated with RNAse of E/G family
MRRLTPILEIKQTLAGVEKRFDCLKLAGDARHVVVLWIAREPMHVHGVDLPAGTVSFGHFWSDRFYNVYHWVDAAQRTIGLYFNIADQTQIGPEQLAWRDLVVDVLATPEGRLEVLDEDELPAALAPDVAEHLAAGKAAILDAPKAVIAEIEAASRALYPLVFAS